MRLSKTDTTSCRKGKSFMSESMRRSLLTRREALFLSATAGISVAAGNPVLASDSVKTSAHQEPCNCSTPRSAQYGKVRGFLDASEIGGSAYEDSVNVGMTDLVAALRWVKENIENFGGDPDRVMIYGQSGGGSKVTTLMGMPSATNLFHRAAAQSGGGGNIPSKDQQKELARQLMKELGLAANEIGSLQKMEWSRLFAAGNAAAAKINPAGPPMMGAGVPGTPRVGWSPCVDVK
jgi:para-nitrobenzyl esterase